MKARKEITVAVIISLVIGLIVVGGVLRARSAITKLSTPSPSSSTKQSDTNSGTKSEQGNDFDLTINTPDNQVVSDNVLTVQGETLPGTYIVILGEKGEYIIVPNEVGAFSQEVSLVKGANTIKVTVYQESGEKIEKVITAVYSTSEI